LTTDANALASATGSVAEISVAAAKMRSDVLALEATGGLSSARAAAVLVQVQRIVADAALLPIVSTPAPANSLPPVPNTAVPTTAAPGSGHGRNKDGTPPGKGKPHG
jgi:hypothetical protein